jgi:hypothetical protein
MYVADITSVEELNSLLVGRRPECCEQCGWDFEDVENRIAELA